MTSRRVRGPAAHRAADRAAACKTLSVCYLPSRALRWGAPTGNDGAAARAGSPGGRWRGIPRQNDTVRRGRGARDRDAKPRTAPVARRRDEDIAPYRNGTVPRGTPGRAPRWGALTGDDGAAARAGRSGGRWRGITAPKRRGAARGAAGGRAARAMRVGNGINKL